MATGEDQRLTCVNCGEEFLFTAGEQEFYKERGLSHAPTRCKRCREQRKGQRPQGAAGAPARAPARPGKPGGAAHGSAGRETFAATCANCGRETQVPFRPVAGRPVYCRDCFRDRKHPGGAGTARAAPRAPARPADGGEAAPGTRQQGTVKWFDKAKGFGVIRDDAGEDIFVHSSAFSGDDFKSLTQGEHVGFDVVVGARGRQAANVSRLG